MSQFGKSGRAKSGMQGTDFEGVYLIMEDCWGQQQVTHPLREKDIEQGQKFDEHSRAELPKFSY